jgi:subtilisin
MAERASKSSAESDGQQPSAATESGRLGAPSIIGRATKTYLIAPRRGFMAASVGLRPLSTSTMRSAVQGLDVIKTIRPRRGLGPLAVSADEATETYVVRIEPNRAEALMKSAPPSVIVERDHRVGYGDQVTAFGSAPTNGRLTKAGQFETKQIQIRVLGAGDKPIVGASAQLTGDGFPSDGITDKQGEAALQLVTISGGRARSLFVNSPHGYWDLYLKDPDLSSEGVNIIQVPDLSATFAGFPDQYRMGWGQRLMGLEGLPGTVGGRGVRIAIVDSGCGNKHPLLKHITRGEDLTENAAPGSWTNDVIGHGTHCAGTIAARDPKEKMLRGFAPEAEIYVFKVFPGGQFSSLIEALDRCIELDVDVVNLSLGSPQPSLAVEQKLEEAMASGVACIVAAGNSGEAVQYPASSPNVLAVAAVGQLNSYPDNTWDASTVLERFVSPDGLFSPSFTCHGPQIGVCGPGVGIVSTVPDGFEPQSGTSMAAPHITGLAALLLAHHPAFKGPLKARNAQRVMGLFNLIRSLCTPLAFGAERSGAGMPRLDGITQILTATEPAQTAADDTVQQGAATAAPGSGQAVPAWPMPTPPMGGVVAGWGSPFGGVDPRALAALASLGWPYASGAPPIDPRLQALLTGRWF